MSRKEKLIRRIKRHPKDFTWRELATVLGMLGFKERANAATGGSRRSFLHPDGIFVSLHEPHPQKVLKQYQVRQVVRLLEEEGMI